MDCQGGHNRCHEPPELGDAEHELADFDHLAAQRIILQRAVLGTEDQQGQIVEDIPDPGGDDDDGNRFPDVLFRLENRLDDDVLEEITENEHDRNDDQQGDIGVHTAQGDGPVGHVHADHQERTVSKIDNFEHPEDQGQAKGGQTIDGAHQDAVDRVFENIQHGSLRSTGFRLRQASRCLSHDLHQRAGFYLPVIGKTGV